MIYKVNHDLIKKLNFSHQLLMKKCLKMSYAYNILSKKKINMILILKDCVFLFVNFQKIVSDIFKNKLTKRLLELNLRNNYSICKYIFLLNFYTQTN